MNFKIVLFLGFNSESTDRIYINKSYLAALIILTVGKDPKRKTLRLFALEIKISHLSPQEKVGGGGGKLFTAAMLMIPLQERTTECMSIRE